MLIDAAGGARKWTWSNHPSMWFPHAERPRTASPVFADVNSGQRCVCLCVTQSDDRRRNEFSRRLLAIGMDGKVCGEFQLEQGKLFGYWQCRLRAADLTGDGRRELIAAYKDRLLVFGGSLDEPVWTWTANDDVEVLEVVSAKEGQQAPIVVRSAQTGVGLNGATGKPIWRCGGPGHVLGVIAPGVDGTPAQIAFIDDSSVVVHESMPATAGGAYDESWGIRQ